MAETQTHVALLEAFAQEPCPVCQLVSRAVARYIESVNYESVGEPFIRRQLRDSLGFCNEHAHQWLNTAFLLGTAQIYADVLASSTDKLRSASFRRPSLLNELTSRLGGRDQNDETCSFIEPTAACLICDVRVAAEGTAIATLVTGLSDSTFLAAYADSPGLCLPHLRRSLYQAADEVVFNALRDAAIAREERLREQLREIARKFDYRFSQEPVGEERGAAERSVNHVIGIHGIRC